MNRAIDSALDLILKDLAIGGVPLPRIDWATWQDWDPSESATLFAADGSGIGVWIDLGLPHAEGVAHLADQIQDWAIEELARLARPTNWPVCPAHPTNHPLKASVKDGQAVWACPSGRAATSPIGGLSRD